MRFKIDENLPIEIAELLQEAGHDAKTVYSENLTGADDASIAEVCRREGRAMITLDLGFSDIRAYPLKDFEGLIVFRLGRQDKPFLLSIAAKLIATLLQREPRGKLWIVEEKRIRVRE